MHPDCFRGGWVKFDRWSEWKRSSSPTIIPTLCQSLSQGERVDTNCIVVSLHTNYTDITGIFKGCIIVAVEHARTQGRDIKKQNYKCIYNSWRGTWKQAQCNKYHIVTGVIIVGNMIFKSHMCATGVTRISTTLQISRYRYKKKLPSIVVMGPYL